MLGGLKHHEVLMVFDRVETERGIKHIAPCKDVTLLSALVLKSADVFLKVLSVFYSYYMETAGGKTLTEQMGVFRTNCIDCLDRTNVVQSLVARKNLQDIFEVVIVVNISSSFSMTLCAFLFVCRKKESWNEACESRTKSSSNSSSKTVTVKAMLETVNFFSWFNLSTIFQCGLTTRTRLLNSMLARVLSSISILVLELKPSLYPVRCQTSRCRSRWTAIPLSISMLLVSRERF